MGHINRSRPNQGKLAMTTIIAVIITLIGVNGDIGFDTLIYTQQWPETMCLKSRLAHEKCVIPQNVTTWTVHGLWPTKNGTRGPNNCNDSMKFDPTMLKPIDSSLWKYWPNLLPEGPDIYEFWEHEWYKHGTCAARLPSTNNEYKYFNTALKMKFKYNFDQFLIKAEMPPSKISTYSISEFTSAIENTLGKKVHMECFIYKGVQYVYQVEVCMDLKFSLIDCQTTGGACSSKMNVTYPPIQHP